MSPDQPFFDETAALFDATAGWVAVHSPRVPAKPIREAAAHLRLRSIEDARGLVIQSICAAGMAAEPLTLEICLKMQRAVEILDHQSRDLSRAPY